MAESPFHGMMRLAQATLRPAPAGVKDRRRGVLSDLREVVPGVAEVVRDQRLERHRGAAPDATGYGELFRGDAPHHVGEVAVHGGPQLDERPPVLRRVVLAAHPVLLGVSGKLQRIGELGVRLLGRAGLSRDDVAGLPSRTLLGKHLNSLSLTIAAGSSQIQRNIIAERILGLPKDR